MPAGGNGTIIRIGRDGKVCAHAAAEMSRQETRLSSARMVPSLSDIPALNMFGQA